MKNPRGRKAALNHMLKTGLYTTEDVEVMRRYSNVLCKISDTWVSGDPSLPDGWRIRKYNSKPTSKRVIICFSCVVFTFNLDF